MLKRGIMLFAIVSVTGCAAVPAKPDPQIQLAPVRKAYGDYNECLRQNLKPFLKPKADPKKVADAVAIKCEPGVLEYKSAVKEVYAKGLDPKMGGYDDLLLTKPENHANRIREKGKKATMARVLNARKSAVQ